jgi:hypothetical protein
VRVLLASRGWVILHDLLPAFHIGSLRRYLRAQIRLGRLTFGDDQSPGRYVAHNEPVAAYFHHQLARAVSDVVGTAVKPSYSYIVSYQGGADLEPHTDREQCEYTLSLCIDATPEPLAQAPWPLWLQSPGGPVAIWQHLGDGLLMRGRRISHWRNALPEGQTATNLLLHYVDSQFAGQLS